MSNVGQLERVTQDRVIELLDKRLRYTYLGNLATRTDNTNVNETLLTENLNKRGYEPKVITKAIAQLKSDATLGGGRTLYEANSDVYSLLRYGVKVRSEIGDPITAVKLIDWDTPSNNDFYVAEEVAIPGINSKRPDIVLYVNGIALVTIELKRSIVSISDGIRQTIGNQRTEFIQAFFSTIQLVVAGNDTEGARYGVIETPEKYWLSWNPPADAEPVVPDDMNRLDRDLTRLLEPTRLLEIIHDFIVFDAGTKKTCRHNQYFGVKAAQARVARREGGIIWHTQGSGKSLTMVWLAKWILETQTNGRVLIVTDRTELDEQIERVFLGVGESIYRARSAADLVATLNTSKESLICSLVHKFRGNDGTEADGTDEYVKQLRASLPKDFKAKGNIFVFIDEAHRTQSGKMHAALKELLPNAMLIGFTGTPLIKADKATSIETFGSFIHTYKFDEAVADGVVLDLLYEAKDIEQKLTEPDKVDILLDAKTQGMNDLAKAELKKRWGTMQNVVSSASRAQRIVNDILFDMDTKPRLMDGRGNALLVCEDIHQACKFYELFKATTLKGKVAIVTSYKPSPSAISKEDAGEGNTKELDQYETYRGMLSEFFDEPADEAIKRVEEFEKRVKDKFIKQPGQMRLLIVVDKLLTGFDAPSATYLYIDKKMRDHGLFQAICRVNRLDGDDKEYGYIVDYRDLFNSVRDAIHDYTSGALDAYDKDDIDGLLKDRITVAREDLDNALELVRALVEPVAPPKGPLEYQKYFCAADAGNADQLKTNEPLRVELYKAVSRLVRVYSNVANEMADAGYTDSEAASIKTEIADYVAVRDEIRLGAGDYVDFKKHEPAMRQLLDTYISAEASTTLANFEDAGLVELIVKLGPAALDHLPEGIKASKDAVAETIVNNVRKLIIDEHAVNPKYYDKMSALLDALLEKRRLDAIEYKEFLDDLVVLAAQIKNGESSTLYPAWVKNTAQRSLCDYFDGHAELARAIDQAVIENKPADWVGNTSKERIVRREIRKALTAAGADPDTADDVLELVKAQREYK